MFSGHHVQMDSAVLLGGPVLMAMGVWIVTHPNGGYRAAGGAGSGLSPSTRRTIGIVFIVAAVLGMILAVLG
jgi:hypothetical protein